MEFKNLRVKNVRSVLRYRPNIKKWSAKKRKDHIVGRQLRGSARHDFGYQKFVLSGDCIFFFNQRDDYDVEVLEETEAFSIHFTTYEEISTDSFCIPITNISEMESILRNAESAKRVGDDLKLLAFVYRFCSELERIRENPYCHKDARMHAAKRYIDIHFKDSNCLSAAIAQSGISSRHFSTLFRNNFVITPNRYLTVRRIEHAKQMLETKSLTVSEIAELCGFSDVYYFSKVFKQICGIPPSKWK